MTPSRVSKVPTTSFLTGSLRLFEIRRASSYCSIELTLPGRAARQDAQNDDEEAEAMTTTAAIYTRVSTEDQAERGYSLASQVRELRAMAQRKGYVIAVEFQDDGVSGSTLERPAL